MSTISISTAAACTTRGSAAWMRRVESGEIKTGPRDGGRIMLDLRQVLPLIGLRMTPEQIEAFQRADQGDAEAQYEMGKMFLNAGRAPAVHYWLNKAAGQGHRQAKSILSRCYRDGIGVPKDAAMAERLRAESQEKK